MVTSAEHRARAEENLAQVDRDDSRTPSAVEAFMALTADSIDCAAGPLWRPRQSAQPQQIQSNSKK
jgi:hypothetical protein